MIEFVISNARWQFTEASVVLSSCAQVAAPGAMALLEQGHNFQVVLLAQASVQAASSRGARGEWMQSRHVCPGCRPERAKGRGKHERGGGESRKR